MRFLTTTIFAMILSIAGMAQDASLSFTIEELMALDLDSLNKANISTVPLAKRVISADGQLHDSLSANTKIIYTPDGMHNIGGFIEEQEQFNLFNFTNWSYIDIFCWFGGPVIMPSRPWIEAAHTNGVKIIGCVFLAPNVYGGTEEEMMVLLEKDSVTGNFIAADKLKAISDYYGFDGWIMNFETNVSSAAGSLGLEFMQYFKSILDEGDELIWYDALTESGAVSWQNALTTANLPYAEASTGIFTNYWWNARRIEKSYETAIENQFDPYLVYSGADMWPGRSEQRAFSNYSWLDELHLNERVSQPLSSIALFAMNFTNRSDVGYSVFDTSAADYERFYDTEQTVFGGLDINPAKVDGEKEYKGLAHYIPTRTTVHQFPFETNFCTGHGFNRMVNGTIVEEDWHYLVHQDELPSWQFAQEGDSLDISIDYDFEDPYKKGNSIAYTAPKLLGGTMSNPLYSAEMFITGSAQVELVYKTQEGTAATHQLALYFASNPDKPFYYDLPTTNGKWDSTTVHLVNDHRYNTLTKIGVAISSKGGEVDYKFNIGQLFVGFATGIEEEKKTEYKVYPNPATDVITIENLGADLSTFQLINPLGQVVKQIQLTGSQKVIDVKDLDAGLFHYVIENNNGTIQEGKLMLL